MSFITKRERVFNDYDLYDLPARNEGKLKAYSSCTDARAWSHFCSDKSEHLVELIKRNNEVCRPKYVPTEAIVNTLLAHKQAEIARLKQKISEFEQMIAAYDDLELTSEQKFEITKAHTSIKEANKDLHELWFDLNLSAYTGIDSEDFETGKSRGDEPAKVKPDEGDDVSYSPSLSRLNTPRSKGDDMVDEWSMGKELAQTESIGNQTVATKLTTCEASTNAVDPRIQEMTDVIIAKDAKLSAMKNTYAIVENDVCEPYCIYAHIYTALEKIYGILCQNDKYKLYLNLMTAGKDIRGIDIKGKILFKLKVLEKFSLALIAPCSRDFQSTDDIDCSCYRAEIISSVETAYALTSAETQKPEDKKRAQLVADIMENDEMIELLNKDFKENMEDEDDQGHNNIVYNIDQENVKRLKNLQQSYDDLMNCYESLKHEKDCLQIRCRKYEDLEKDFENLQIQLREYNSLWNEKEHYRKRSEDLDSLKEQYLVLYDETKGLETQIKAETEINDVKTKTIDELRNDNIELERKLNEASIAFEKERNCAQCKLKESECKIMCQGQQIKSLSIQIDRLLEQDPDQLQSKFTDVSAIALIDEINSLKEQIKTLKDALYCSEEGKQQLQEEYHNKLNLINDLKMSIEDWKSNYEKALEQNDYLEKYRDGIRDEIHKLIEENRVLTQDLNEKSNAIDNLLDVLNNKSIEINKLEEDIDRKNKENHDLYTNINNLQEAYNKNLSALESEKMHARETLQTSRKESQELLEKVKDYDKIINQHKNQTEEYNQLKALLLNTQKENENLKTDLTSRENNNLILLQEIQRLQEVNDFAVNNMNALQDEKDRYRTSLELTKKDSKILGERLQSLDSLSYQYRELNESYENLLREKNRLEKELADKTLELDEAIKTIDLTKKESELQLKDTENLESDFKSVESAYKKLIKEQQNLQLELEEKKQEFDNLLESYNNLKNNLRRISHQSSEEVGSLSRELNELKNCYDLLLAEKNTLHMDNVGKSEEIDNLLNKLKNKIDENRDLSERLRLLEYNHKKAQDNIVSLQEENYSTSNALSALRNESDELLNKIKCYKALESDYAKLRRENDQIKGENNHLLQELDKQKAKISKISKDNEDLQCESQGLLSHSEDLERALINARTELIAQTSIPNNLHADVIKQIEEMKKERIENAIKIRELHDQLDASENVISDLTESISARDDRIAILENHINKLQDEVRLLQETLSKMIDTGEEMRSISQQKITESLDTMEAHHSKAAHNMKMELAKLQSDNMKLEERLSISKIKSEDSARDKHKYISQIINLQNEREIIITDIKQLELKSVGDSALSPNNCATKDVLISLDRIRQYIETRITKSSSLEQTLLKVQSSYQIVQSKADEAKKIVEKEKQKIMNEKEEAIKDRINMEKQLKDLENKLEKQIAQDKNVIKDLEAEILNQKLICDKLNESTQSYISKLREEMNSLQDLYQKSLNTISELKKKLGSITEENNANLDLIEMINNKLQEKSRDVDNLKKDLDILTNKSLKSSAAQAKIKSRDKETQTTEEFLYEGYSEYNTNKIKCFDKEAGTENSGALEKKIGYVDKPLHVNEMQVLVANVEPTVDYVRNTYLAHKLKNLNFGQLQQYSVSGTSQNDTELDTKDFNEMSEKEKCGRDLTSVQSIENINVIDIYNKQSMHTNSSKIIDSNYPDNEKGSKSLGLTSTNTDFDFTAESVEAKNGNQKTSNLFGSVSGTMTNKDLFLIYKDSETNKDQDKNTWTVNNYSELADKTISNRSESQQYDARTNLKEFDVEKDFFYQEDEELEDDSVKQKLKINIPRISSDSPTIDIFSGEEKKSSDSFSVINNATKSKDNKQFMELNVSTDKDNNKFNEKLRRGKTSCSVPSTDYKNQYTSPTSTVHGRTKGGNSHHELSRTGADVRLIKNTTDPTVKQELDKGTNVKTISHFTSNYADNAADDNNSYGRSIRQTRSHEILSETKLLARYDKDILLPSETKKSTFDEDQLSFIILSKQYVDKEIMAKLDPIEEYEIQIKNLTNNLENIEKDYKKKIAMIKIQYDTNIKSILNEHNQGVRSIQGLHEETLHDIIKHHENEVENLRSMSIEAMKRAEKLEKEVQCLKCKLPICGLTCLDEVFSSEGPVRISSNETSKQKQLRADTKTLTQTNVEAFNVKPKIRSNGPCTCSLDINISDTIRNIFEQVDVDQRKIAEQMYIKYIANKILNSTVEALDSQELSFLHLKVCRIWKIKQSKEEMLQKRISSLEAEVITKQRHNQQNIAELDRQVAEERRRLQEVREAVCRNSSVATKLTNPNHSSAPFSNAAYADYLCNCNAASCSLNVTEQLKSAGDVGPVATAAVGPRLKRVKHDSNRATNVKLDTDERREKKLYNDEPPTRLRRPHDRLAAPARPYKK